MKITRVKTNLKTGCDLEIGEKTLIVGPNGSGKSTVTNAIELALTGRVSDIAGRTDIAREADVMTLAPEGADVLYATVEFDSGQTAQYRTEGSTAKAKKAVRNSISGIDAETVLPLRMLKEAMTGSSDKARKFLVSRGPSATEADVKSVLPAHAQKKFNALVNVVQMPGMTGVDLLVAVMEKAGAKAREATKEMGAFEAVSMAYTGGLTSPPTESDVAQAEIDWTKAVNAKASFGASKSRVEALATLEEKLAALQAKEDAYVKLLTDAKAEADKHPVPQAPLDGLVETLKVIDVSAEAGECLACGSEPSLTELADRKTLINDALKGYRAGLQAHQAANDKLGQAQRQVNEYLASVDAASVQVQTAKDALGSVAQGDEGALAAAVAETQKEYLALKNSRDAWVAADRARTGAAKAKIESEEWKALTEACKEAVDRLLNRSLNNYVNDVRMLLPGSDNFDVLLQAGDREVVQFGLMKGEAMHTALSGAEWARVTAAMASAAVPKGQFAVIIPEERAFDPDTLKEVMEALTACPHQVIITSPIAPKRAPKGWTVIKRGKDE